VQSANLQISKIIERSISEMKKGYIGPLTLWSSIKIFPFEINYFFIHIKFFYHPHRIYAGNKARLAPLFFDIPKKIKQERKS
jgi:hypothetical protein